MIKPNTNKTYDPPLLQTAKIRSQSVILIENNENVNQEYNIPYHIEIFDNENVIEMTVKNANNITIQINKIDTVIDVNDNKTKRR